MKLAEGGESTRISGGKRAAAWPGEMPEKRRQKTGANSSPLPLHNMTMLSDRVQELPKYTAEYLMFIWQKPPEEFYNIETNPNGIAVLTIAENVLTIDMLAQKMKVVLILPNQHLFYTTKQQDVINTITLRTLFQTHMLLKEVPAIPKEVCMYGMGMGLRTALAKMFAKTFFKGRTLKHDV